jgi:hypothetical protein
MKGIFSTLVFTLFGIGLFAQADTIFVIGAEFGVVTVVDDSTFQVSSEHPADQLGQGFLPTQIQVGYQLFDINGRLFRVSSIVSANFGESVMQVVELQDNNIGPVGVGVVYRKPDNSDCVPIIPQGNTGLSPAIVAKIHNHNAVVGCGGTGGGGSGTIETVVAGTGISVDATDPANPIVTNTGIITEVDGDITNEGRLGVGAGISTSATITTNTSGSNPVSLEVGTGLSISEVAGTNGGIITFTNSAPDQVVTLTEGANTTITGAYPNFTIASAGGGGGGGDVTGPASSTDNAITRFDGTTGKLIQNSTVTIDDSGNTNIPGNITGGMRFSGTGSIKIGNTLSAFETNTADGFFYHTTSGGAYPFDRTSNLVIQARRSSSKDIVFVTGSTPSVRMNVQGSNGFVGIGTSTPTERLDVSGNLKVSGTISTAGFLNTVSFGGTGHLAINVLNSSFQTGLGGPVVYATAAGGTYPFDNNANLVIQARDVVGRDIIFATGQTTPLSRVIVSDQGLAIGETRPSYSFEIQGTSAAAMFTPHDVTLTGAEGLIYPDLSEHTWKGHNGTSFFRFMQQSATIPTSGQVGVWNATTLLYEPTTVPLTAELFTGVTEYSDNVLDGDPNRGVRAVDGDVEAFVGTGESYDVSLEQNLPTSELTLYDDDGVRAGVRVTSDGTYLTHTQRPITIQSFGTGTTFAKLNIGGGTGASSAVISGELGNFAGIQELEDYSADYTTSSLTRKSYVDNLFAQGFQGSILLPDSLVSILTSDGAGIEFSGDYVNLVGTEVLANGQVIPMNDTLVVPVYCHPHGEAAATGNDYRGWRVPPDLDGARLIGVHYSFDTPGSDTAIIQIGNGAVNVFGGTIPATGFVNVTASRVLVENEKWTPSIGTLNGTGHEGLMLNLIIERNR